MESQWGVNGGSMGGQWKSMGGQWGVNDESMWVDNGLNGKYTNKAPKPPT